MRAGFGLGIPARAHSPGWVLDGAALDIDFAGGRGYSGGVIADPAALLSASRASSAWGEDASGAINAYPANAARILAGRGLLVEGGRQNLVLDNTFTAEVSVTAPTDPGANIEQVSTPAGISGVSIAFDSGNTVRFGTNSLTSGNSYAVSGWAILPPGGTGLDANLAGGSANVGSSLTPGEWTRFNATIVAGSAGNFLELGHASLAGDTLILGGLQIEAASYSSSPILTTGSAALRASESISLADISFLTDAMTWRLEWEDAPLQSGDFRTLVELTKVSEDTRYTLVINTSNNLVLAVGNSGFLGSLQASQSIDDGARHSAAFTFTAGASQALCADGGAAVTASMSGPAAADLAQVMIGMRTSSSNLGGIVRRISAWQNAATPTELPGYSD